MSWNDPERIRPLFVIQCGKRWDDLEPDPEHADRRHCTHCQRHVFRAETEPAFEVLRSAGKCIHIPGPIEPLTGAAPRHVPTGQGEVIELPPHLQREWIELLRRGAPHEASDELRAILFRPAPPPAPMPRTWPRIAVGLAVLAVLLAALACLALR